MSGVHTKFSDIHGTIKDLIAAADKVVVRNTWTATDIETGTKLQMSGIVIWRVAHRQLVERWAYTESRTPPFRELKVADHQAQAFEQYC